MRKLPKVDRCEVVRMMILARIFNEVHTLVDVVYIIVGKGDMVVPFSF